MATANSATDINLARSRRFVRKQAGDLLIGADALAIRCMRGKNSSGSRQHPPQKVLVMTPQLGCSSSGALDV